MGGREILHRSRLPSRCLEMRLGAWVAEGPASLDRHHWAGDVNPVRSRPLPSPQDSCDSGALKLQETRT